MGIDWRVLIVFLPIILAGSWAAYNVLKLALEQAQKFWNEKA